MRLWIHEEAGTHQKSKKKGAEKLMKINIGNFFKMSVI